MLTTWHVATLQRELESAGACLYVLTNSRSLPPAQAADLNRQVARNLRTAACRSAGFDVPASGEPMPAQWRAICAEAFTLVSRSDSTLRGHFPLETDVLNEELGPFDATILIPYFDAGGRYTIDDVHYVADDDRLLPAAETAFARDAVFGYAHSNLREWVEEKTAGRVAAGMVQTFSIGELRAGGPHEPTPRAFLKLRALRDGAVAIVNACHQRDLQVFALASLSAEQAGGRYLFRSAAEFVAARLGLEPRPLLEEMSRSCPSHGGLFVIGSYVSKTTEQLERLLRGSPNLTAVEVEVGAVLDESQGPELIAGITRRVRDSIAAGRDTVLFTSRQFVGESNGTLSLAVGRRISEALVEIVRGIGVQPRFLIAKGGITSSDVATRGLDVRRACVRGQILPGVPVWSLGGESRFPGMDYIVFPGNVGGPDALLELYGKLARMSAGPQ